MGGAARFFARVGQGSVRAIRRAAQSAKAGLRAVWNAVKKGARLFKNAAGAIRRGLQQRFGAALRGARSRFQEVARDMVDNVPQFLSAMKERFLDLANSAVDGFHKRVRSVMNEYDLGNITRAAFQSAMRNTVLSATLAGVIAGVKGIANLSPESIARYKDIAAENLAFLERFFEAVEAKKQARVSLSGLLTRAANYATTIVRGFWDGHRMHVANAWEFGKNVARLLSEPFLMAAMREGGFVSFKSFLNSMRRMARPTTQSSQDTTTSQGDQFGPDDIVEVWTMARRISACTGRVPELHCQTCDAFHEMSRSSPQRSGTFPAPASGATECGICCGCVIDSMTYGEWQRRFA